MAKKKAAIEDFQYWKENKLNQHYTLTAEELKEKFADYLHTKEIDWLKYYGTYQVYLDFVGRHLQSVAEHTEDNDATEILRDVLSKHIQSFD